MHFHKCLPLMLKDSKVDRNNGSSFRMDPKAVRVPSEPACGRVPLSGSLSLFLKGNSLRLVKDADTCRTYVVPKPRSAGWDTERHCTDAGYLADIIARLTERGIDFLSVAGHTGQPDANRFGLLCNLTFNVPVLTRHRGAERVRKEQTAFFKYVAAEPRENLNDLLEKYARDGELKFRFPDVLKFRSFCDTATNAIIAISGGTYNLLGPMNHLQTLIHK